MPSSFTPQQIEQFLQEFFDVVGARQYIGARYVPIFGRAGEDTVEWDDRAPYEPLTVVMHEGVSYVSRRYVPTGIQITDTNYWVETYRFNAQVEQYRQEVLQFQSQIDQISEDMESDYVPFPDSSTYPKYGTTGQVLTTLSDGSTKWENPVVPSDEQAEEVITEWLDAHPEATTTVQDGAITNVKIADNTITDSKLKQNDGIVPRVNGLIDVLNNIIDTTPMPDYIWEQGGYSNIGVWDNPQPSNVSERIRCQLDVSCSKIHIQALNGYKFAYATFDQNLTVINIGVATNNTNVTLTGNIKHLALVMKNASDTALTIAEASNLKITLDDKPITFTELVQYSDNKVASLKAEEYGYYSLKDAVENSIDTNPLINATWVQGSWGNIGYWDNPNPNTNSTRIRLELSVNVKRYIRVKTNNNYQFAAATFDSGHSNLQTYSSTNHTDSTLRVDGNNIAYIRLVLARPDTSENISVFEAGNIEIIIDDIPMSFSQLIDKIDVDSSKWSIYKYGGNIKDWFKFNIGGYTAIWDYSTPGANGLYSRLKSEIVFDEPTDIHMSLTSTTYQYTYAVFDNNNELIYSYASWGNYDVVYRNVKTLRISLRYVDDSLFTSTDISNIPLIVTVINSGDSCKLKVMTYNIGHYSYGVSPSYLDTDYDEKLANYKRFFSSEMCDIIGLQEANVYLDGASSGTKNANEIIYDYLYPYHSDYANWTCLKSKYLLFNAGTSQLSTGRGYAYATMFINGRQIYLLSVHITPNSGSEPDAARAQEVQEIITLMQAHDTSICFGDFNAQTTALFDAFTTAGMKIANGGYLPFEFTYSYDPSDYSSDTPSDNIRYFDNIVVTPNITIDYCEKCNVYSDLSSDHLPFVAWLTIE